MVIDRSGGLLWRIEIGTSEEPLVNEVVESMVGDQSCVMKPLHCDWACEVPFGKPPLDAWPVISLASAKSDWISQQIQAYWTSEQMRDAHLCSL